MIVWIYLQSYRFLVFFNKKEYILYIVNIGRREFENVIFLGKDLKIMKVNLIGFCEGVKVYFKVYLFDEVFIFDIC